MSTGEVRTVAIVGAGQAGFQAAASLRELGFAGDVVLFGEEPYLPYQRPPLSKTYIKEDVGPDKVYLRPERFFAEQRITCRTDSRVTAIDRQARTLTLAGGETRAWDRLVLTTGVVNRHLPVPGAELDGVVMLRGIDDAQALRQRIKSARRIVIVGGGVIGLEVAAVARAAGIDTTVVELGDRLAGRIGSAALSEHLLQFHRSNGTKVLLSAGLTQIAGRDGRVAAAHVSTGEVVEADLVLVAIGVLPNVELAKAAGLTNEDGIVVDQHMQSSDTAILAAGDCTRFKPPHGALSSVRLESVQNAIDQAKCAAETIAGRPRAYDALPWFWSDQGSLKLQIAGLTAGHDKTVAKADPVKGSLAVYCFARDQLIGVECVNRPADFMAARRVLAARKAVRTADVDLDGFELKQFMC
jgi:3-phenylpropionate/trans-cinnamate dioxygenase ferredoxin reductase subunit